MRAYPRRERTVFKGQKVYKKHKDVLTSETIHSERKMCLDKKVVGYTIEECRIV